MVVPHTPDWGADGGHPGFAIDAIKYDYVKKIAFMILLQKGKCTYYLKIN
ncbi:MAG: hypothetical protein CM15mV41_1210 [Caudoviricetes sp.]|nr:MAG: hypothetical protein CM15mV41_1210 [Caudoviricetes sp.]